MGAPDIVFFVQMDHLTFNAPVISITFLLVALIVGWWSRYTGRLLRRA